MKTISFLIFFIPIISFSQGKYFGGDGSGYASSEIVLTTLSIQEISKDLGIYPNPSASIIHLKTVLKSESKIIDINGKNVLTLKPNTTQINISRLSQGTYFLVYKTWTYRFIKK